MENTKIKLYLTILSLCTACVRLQEGSGKELNSVGKQSLYETEIDTTYHETSRVKISENKYDSLDFFTDCKTELEVWSGSIQGFTTTKKRKLIFCRCYESNTLNKAYDLLLVTLDSNITDPSAQLVLYNKSKANDDYSNFKCFAFTSNIKPKNNPENEFDVFDYDYPFISEVYAYTNGSWSYFTRSLINSFEEFGYFKHNVVIKQQE